MYCNFIEIIGAFKLTSLYLQNLSVFNYLVLGMDTDWNRSHHEPERKGAWS